MVGVFQKALGAFGHIKVSTPITVILMVGRSYDRN